MPRPKSSEPSSFAMAGGAQRGRICSLRAEKSAMTPRVPQHHAGSARHDAGSSSSCQSLGAIRICIFCTILDKSAVAAMVAAAWTA